jgi:hypothetical protein
MNKLRSLPELQPTHNFFPIQPTASGKKKIVRLRWEIFFVRSKAYTQILSREYPVLCAQLRNLMFFKSNWIFLFD